MSGSSVSPLSGWGMPISPWLRLTNPSAPLATVRRISATPIVTIARKSSLSRTTGSATSTTSTSAATMPASHPTGTGSSSPRMWDSNELGGGSVSSAAV